MREAIDGLLRQSVDEVMNFDAAVENLVNLAAQCRLKLSAPVAQAPAIVGKGAPGVANAAV